MGGVSEEYEISLLSGNEVQKALKKNYVTEKIFITHDLKKTLKSINNFKPDIIFNALHGKFGEDGQIQGILNTLKIPYTHSNLLASSIGMNKYMSKIIFEKVGIKCPEGCVSSIKKLKNSKLNFPLILKPNNGGSSVNISKVDNYEELNQIKSNKKFLIESFIPGREITVGILNDKICGITEIIYPENFYDYKSKYIKVAKHIINPKLPDDIKKKLKHHSLLAHKTIGCNCISRSDFRFDENKNEVFLMEINTQPGLTKDSLLPEMAKFRKISFLGLCEILMQNAKCEG